MKKVLVEKLAQEKQGFKVYAADKLGKAYPEYAVKIDHVAVSANNNRRWLTAIIGNEQAFGAGYSNLEAVENLISTFRPKTAAEKVEYDRTHSANLVSMFSDEPH